jgi:hypothetical protein
MNVMFRMRIKRGSIKNSNPLFCPSYNKNRTASCEAVLFL